MTSHASNTVSSSATPAPAAGVTFAELLAAAPDIGQRIDARLRATGLAMLGTVRRDGSPRVSPIEISLQDGSLYVGMMPRSQKHLDALRDPRACLLTPVADKDDLAGEGKLFGALELLDAHRAHCVLERSAADVGFDPERVAGAPAFEVRIAAAAWQHVEGETFVTRSWRVGEGVRVRHRTEATDVPVDVPAGA